MRWTNESPTEEGWYWFQMGNVDKRMVIVYVISENHMVAVGTEQEGNPSFQKGSWFGPLEPPPYEECESQP
jgi:hypothetical protein